MSLQPWNGEPRTYELLATFCGGIARLRPFLAQWAKVRGSLELLAAPLCDAALQQEGASPEADDRAYVLAVGRAPGYGQVRWWLAQPEWRLFYRPVDPEAARPAGAEFVPAGEFLPWGFTSDTPVRAAGALALLLADGARLTPTPGAGFVSFFGTCQKELGVSVLLSFGLVPASQTEPGADGKVFSLSISLVPRHIERTPSNLDYEISRMRRMRNQAEEQLEALEWLQAQATVCATMSVYPETMNRDVPGSAWALRRWFLQTSGAALRQFHHARVEVSGQGVFHLVVPADLNRPPSVILPTPADKLTLDPRWHRKGRRLFVSPDLEVWPSPPAANPALENLLAASLWEGAGPSVTLVVRRDRSTGQDHRFSVPQFRPLVEQHQALSVEVAIASLMVEGEESIAHRAAELAGRVREEVTEHMEREVDAIRGELDRLWGEERNQLEDYRRRVTALEQQLGDLRIWLQRTEGRLKGNAAHLDHWRGFVQEVLALDAQLAEIADQDARS